MNLTSYATIFSLFMTLALLSLTDASTRKSNKMDNEKAHTLEQQQERNLFDGDTWEFCFQCDHPDEWYDGTNSNILVEWFDWGWNRLGEYVLDGCSSQRCPTIQQASGIEVYAVTLTIQGNDAMLIDYARLKRNGFEQQNFDTWWGGHAFCLSKHWDDANGGWEDTVGGDCYESLSFEMDGSVYDNTPWI